MMQHLDYETPQPKSKSLAVPSLAFTYPDRWRSYRRRWWLRWGSFLGLIPTELVVGVPLSKALNSDAPFIGVGFIGMACSCAARERTPSRGRCGRSFEPACRAADCPGLGPGGRGTRARFARACVFTTTAAVTDLATKTTAARAAYNAQQAAQNAAKAATIDFNLAVDAMTTRGADIIKQIKAKAATAATACTRWRRSPRRRRRRPKSTRPASRAISSSRSRRAARSTSSGSAPTRGRHRHDLPDLAAHRPDGVSSSTSAAPARRSSPTTRCRWDRRR
jgi:hypothetical protein